MRGSDLQKVGNSVINNDSHLAKVAAQNLKVSVRSTSRFGMQATASPLAKVAARIINV